MQPEVGKQFEALWHSSDSPPDVHLFLQQHPGLSASEVLAVLLQDQRFRWQSNQPFKVEDYLADFPALADNRVDLVVGEFQARHLDATSADFAEFESRFSDISESLRVKLSALAMAGELTVQDAAAKEPKQVPRQEDLSITFLQESIDGETCGGRYRPVRLLGEGGFGRVYLAFDTELRRQVAVKVPTAAHFKKPEDAEVYLAEARTVAALDHPHIVPVFDMGRTDDGSIYVVSKLIEGRTLKALIADERPGHTEAAKLVATIAQGLQHAHERHIIHRDIKPGNILIEDNTHTAYVADFGLAIREDDSLHHHKIAGTPAYMSPEQARGEGHRLDGRSDVYSLGVVLYELLVGKRPFRGSTSNEMLHQVVSVDPPTPRSIDDSIPAELERICLKAISKRASDRYQTAAEFASDLLSWKHEPSNEGKDLQIVPKGLRSFDAEDADFFLDLLPGPRCRDGLPEDIRFWKTRMEETDPDKTFNIGLIYGPSGCGKSSMVKAGLIPRLSPDVTAIYLEATPDDTETRILRGVRKFVPALPSNLGLVETFSWLRRQEGRKVVLVLDQFEQWLHVHRAESDSELVRALRQCDGGGLQAVIMVRDDFSMAASRFMRELETRILEGHNFATVDLFDTVHARKVLTKFGQAFGKLPAQTSRITADQQQFLKAVVSGLADDGKVVSVRLALFAEMVKGKPWVPLTLQQVGGTKGIGSNFLEEVFGSRNANPEHLHHQLAARQVLMSLLPEVGSDIKGHMRSHAELLEASRYQDRPRDFNDLLRILDGKLRLITPTDPEGFHSESSSNRSSKYYQLTHDYLVPSLREWLTRKQKETPRGRAELKLVERSAVWTAKPEQRHLPSLLEWSRIKWLTQQDSWTEPQRRMMKTAGRVHGVRLTCLFGLIATVSLTGLHLRDRVIEANRDERATGFVTALINAELGQIPAILDDLHEDRAWIDPKLKDALPKHTTDSSERLNLSLALLPSDAMQIDYLKDRLLNADPEQVETIRSLLIDYKDALVPDLWQVAEQPETGEQAQLLQAACALAFYDVDNAARWTGVADRVIEALVKENSLRVAVWSKALNPARDYLIAPLGVIYRSNTRLRSQSQIDHATYVLEDYAADDLDILAELLLDGEPMQFLALFDEFAAHGTQAHAKLSEELDRTLSHNWNDDSLDRSWIEPSTELIAKVEQAQGTVAERFAFCQTMAFEEFLSVAEELRRSGYRPTRVRPYSQLDSVRVAATWTRDTRDWRLVMNKTSDEILAEDEKKRSDGFVAVDVAGYIGEASDDESEYFSVLWMKRQNESEDARIFAGVLHAEVQTVRDQLKQSKYEFTNGLQAFRGITGQRKYCGVVWKHENSSTLFLNQSPAAFDETEYVDKISWDIAPGHAGKIQTPRARNLNVLTAAEKILHDDNTHLDARLARGKAHFHLGNSTQALVDFDFLINSGIARVESDPAQRESLTNLIGEAYRYQAILHARTGKADEARQDVMKFNGCNTSASDRVCLNAIVSAHLEDGPVALERLEAFIDEEPENSTSLYAAACTYSVLSSIYLEKDIARAKVYTERAVSLLRQALAQGYANLAHLQSDPALDPIRNVKGFMDIMQSRDFTLRYAAVWNNSALYESQQSHGLSTQDHFAKCQAMQADGFRIVSISTIPINGELITASVWHRPLVNDGDREILARRQANAAVAALRMGDASQLWPLLAHSADPRLRAWIIHRLSPMGASPAMIVRQLNEEKNVSIRRALILILGEYKLPDYKLPDYKIAEYGDAQIDCESLLETLRGLYRSDPDPGIHAAAEWALRRWGQAEDLAKIDIELVLESTGKRPDWHLTKHGHTLISITGPVEFLMGSPNSQRGRSTIEYLHRKRIGHSFAIASKEVTVRQFREFLKDHSFTSKHAPEDDCPQTSVTWYEAAAYCRWLSDQETIPEDQMCYPPIADIKEGMKLPSDYLSRSGYRLPTEAEWEFACRANALTSRYYGETDQLLGQYAWYDDTSEDRSWPVGSLKPNDLGLFDMLGNVQEWCQEQFFEYSTVLGSVSEVREDRLPPKESVRRLLRGGSFGVRATEVRSAHRSYNRPANRYDNAGFRLARTIKEPSS